MKAFALEWFGRLRDCQIDRAQMTAEVSNNLITGYAVKEMSNYLKSYGAATGDEIVESRTMENQRFYLVEIFFHRGGALACSWFDPPAMRFSGSPGTDRLLA